MKFVGRWKTLNLYSNSTFHVKHKIPITGIRLVKHATYDEDGYLSETLEIELSNRFDKTILASYTPSYEVEELQSGDYFLCAIQDETDINIQR